MRVLVALASLVTLALLPAGAEARMRQNEGSHTFSEVHGFRTAHPFRLHNERHARFGRFHRFTRNTNLTPFLGSDFIDGGIDGTAVAADSSAPAVAFAGALPRPPRRPGDDRGTTEMERGVTVVRGPGSRHVAP